MKKEVIYIDTEDDITSIIEKVKASSEKIIALVPPKRAGVLQSAVNLKLLHRAAVSANHHLVLISSDKSLASLAAGVSIPVAKTLQSRPELASLDGAPDMSQEEVINGEELPVGELQKSAAPPPPKPGDEEITLPERLLGEEAVAASPVKKPGKTGPKVPNFSKFRKKLFLAIGGGILLILFLIWAFVFAPHATVNIKAKTNSVDVMLPVTLSSTSATDPSHSMIKTAVQQIKKTDAVTFTATGTKNIGASASGTITISNSDGNCISPSGAATIPANTTVSSNGLSFSTASSISVPAPSLKHTTGPNFVCQPGQTSVAVTAQDIGTQYNLSSGSIFTIQGQDSGVSGSNSSNFSGGTTQQVTAISNTDVSTAEAKITSQDQASVKQQLISQFNSSNDIILSDSFTASPGTPNVNPAVGAQATSGQVSVETTYTLLAISKDDAGSVLDAYLKTKITAQQDQRIYDNGLKNLKLSKYASSADASSVQFVTTGYTGPTIDAAKLKPQLVNKNYEEIRQTVQAIKGVDDVDTTFSPFWVSKVSDQKKIDVVFSVSQK